MPLIHVIIFMHYGEYIKYGQCLLYNEGVDNIYVCSNNRHAGAANNRGVEGEIILQFNIRVAFQYRVRLDWIRIRFAYSSNGITHGIKVMVGLRNFPILGLITLIYPILGEISFLG